MKESIFCLDEECENHSQRKFRKSFLIRSLGFLSHWKFTVLGVVRNVWWTKEVCISKNSFACHVIINVCQMRCVWFSDSSRSWVRGYYPAVCGVPQPPGSSWLLYRSWVHWPSTKELCPQPVAAQVILASQKKCLYENN